MRSRALSLFVAALLVLPARTAWASPGGDDGALAGRLCAGCHAVGPETDRSPLAGAPPFRDIARRWPPEVLAEALAEGIVVGHAEGVRMPEFALTPEEVDALIRYLRRLRDE